MSNGFVDDLDTEYEDTYDGGEAYDDSEAYDDAESTASRARRRRARALRARRRAAAARRPSRPPATAQPRAVVSAVKELDLQTQVQQDTLKEAIAAQNKKFDRSNLATVGVLLTSEAFRTFGEPDNAFVRAGILAAPLLLLAPGQKRRGVEGLISQPVVYGGAGVLALAFIADRRKRNESVKSVTILGPAQLTAHEEDVFVADVLDARDKQSTVTPTWQSDNTAVAQIGPATGRVKALSAGVAIIRASAGGVVRPIRLKVVAASGSE